MHTICVKFVIIQFPLFNKEGLGEILLNKSPSTPNTTTLNFN